VRRVFGPRFVVEVALIVAAAAAGALADLPRLWVFVVIWAAWLLVAAAEWTISRRARPSSAREPEVEPPREPGPLSGSEPLTQGAPEPPLPPEPEPTPKPEPEPEPDLEPEPVSGSEPLTPEPAPRPGLEPPAPRRTAVEAPRTWNLWDLERVTREQAGGDVARDEERSFLLMYLREFADPDGVLPAEFDGLVRDSFGEERP
jgi:outer membrane biosynthesis protein TonB